MRVQRITIAVVALLAALPAAADVLLGSAARLAVDGSPVAVAVTDLDGDGALDLVTANEAGGDGASLSILRGYGNGSFRPEERLNLNPSRYIVQGVSAGDYDGDGLGDLAVAVDDISEFPPRATVLVYLNDDSGQFRRPVAYRVGGLFPRCLQSADVDGDGILDIVACSTDGDSGSGILTVLAGLGDGLFLAGEARALGPAPRGIVVADLDDDGAVDLIATDGEEQALRVFYGSAEGLAEVGDAVAVGAVASSVVALPASDGRAPALLVTSAANSEVLRLTQDPARTFVLAGIDSVEDPPTAALAIDVDRDGRAELVALSAVSHRLVVFALEDGRTARIQRLTVDLLGAGLVGADFNGDGIDDVAVAATGADVTNVFLSGESPAATPTPTLEASEDPTPSPTPDASASPTPACPGDPGCPDPEPTLPPTPPVGGPTHSPTVPMATPTATATPEPTEIVLRPGDPGDANCDGSMDADDLVALLAQMFAWDCEGADVDGDGRVGAADLVLLIDWLAEGLP